MSRKPLHTRRSGVGVFPSRGTSPAMVALSCSPCHTSDEWEWHGRPLWCVRYKMSDPKGEPCIGGYLYARTLTPTYCPLALVSLPPYTADGVECGACGKWVAAEWTEVSRVQDATRLHGRAAKLNPIRFVTWCRTLTAETVQLYCLANASDESSPHPVRRDQTQWRAPAGMPDHPVLDLMRLADDGCPLAAED